MVLLLAENTLNATTAVRASVATAVDFFVILGVLLESLLECLYSPHGSKVLLLQSLERPEEDKSEAVSGTTKGATTRIE